MHTVYSRVSNNRRGVGVNNFWKTNKRGVGIKGGWKWMRWTIENTDISNEHINSYSQFAFAKFSLHFCTRFQFFAH